MQLIEDLKWRYATKKYDSTKKVSEENISKLKKAIHLSASSWGLQLYKFLDIKNPAIRESLKPHSWGQTQITDASHLFVFCSHTTVSDQDTDDYIALKSKVQGMKVEDLKGYGDFMKMKINEKSPGEVKDWTEKQTYLALGNALMACASMKIDATPMEGFEAAKYNEILGLTEKGLTATVVLAVGYRHEEDTAQNQDKIRKPMSTLFETYD